jgi:hypothetical protein
MAYDSKSVKIGKEIKRMLCTFQDKHLRGAILKSYVKIAEDEGRLRSSRNRGDRDTQGTDSIK